MMGVIHMLENYKMYKDGKYVFISKGKRYGERVELNLDIYYPRVNNVSIHEQYGDKDPLMKIVNISKAGVMLLSKAQLKVDDFVNFLIKIEENPSFWCMLQVKWVKIVDKHYQAGCEFYSLKMEEINQINDFVEKSKT